MSRVVCLAACGFVLSACATPRDVLPGSFAGPTAQLSDSSVVYSSHKADFFYVAAIDGTKIQNALAATQGLNAGRGLNQMVQGKARPVAARPTTLHIVGESHYAAPIWSLKGENYAVEGDVRFTPVADQAYIVKGSLGPDYSAVWVEEMQTHVQVGNTLMIRGDSSLNRGSTLLLGNDGAKAARSPVVEEIPPPAD